MTKLLTAVVMSLSLVTTVYAGNEVHSAVRQFDMRALTELIAQKKDLNESYGAVENRSVNDWLEKFSPEVSEHFFYLHKNYGYNDLELSFNPSEELSCDAVELIKMYPDNAYVNSRTFVPLNRAHTPIFDALARCNFAAAKALIRAGVDLEATENFLEGTLLNFVALEMSKFRFLGKFKSEAFLELIRTLVDAGAFTNAKNILGMTPLYSFCLNGLFMAEKMSKESLDIIKELLRGYGLDEKQLTTKIDISSFKEYWACFFTFEHTPSKNRDLCKQDALSLKEIMDHFGIAIKDLHAFVNKY